MTAVLENTLALFFPVLSPQLVTPNWDSSLKSLARQMAPILRGGFECRLAAEEMRVDFQQCIRSDPVEIQVLQKWIALLIAQGGEDLDSRWLGLQSFLNKWSRELSAIPEIWLEFDMDAPLEKLPLPGIFLGLPQCATSGTQALGLAQQSLHLLHKEPLATIWLTSLRLCFQQLPKGAFVSHIGTLLSREFPAIRVNIKRLSPQSVIPFLTQIDWPGDVQELAEGMAHWYGLVDHTTVCLDVGEKIYPHIGLECIIVESVQKQERWASFLENLVQQSLCTPLKKEQLLQWPGVTHPLNAPSPWPEQLIIQSLFRPDAKLECLDRQLSHIKLVWRPQHRLQAKAYLWFQHRFMLPNSP